MAAAESKPLLDVLTLDKPEQLKALGHPLRLRVLETLGAADSEHLTNRELASRLDVDPGHLHFHVRMLLRAGLIQLAESGGPGSRGPVAGADRDHDGAPPADDGRPAGRRAELSSTSIPRRRASACRTSTVSATGSSSRYSSRVSNDSSTDSTASV